MTLTNKCSTCTKRLLSYKSYLTCSICNSKFHNKCCKLSNTNASTILENDYLKNSWICTACTVHTSLPSIFNNLDEPLSDNKKCGSCSKILGKRRTKCAFCDLEVHIRCNKGELGCIKCKSDSRNVICRGKEVMKKIYTCLIRPHIEYCVQLWSPTVAHGSWGTIYN